MNSTYILTTKDETHPPINKIEAPNLTEAIILFSKIDKFFDLKLFFIYILLK